MGFGGFQVTGHTVHWIFIMSTPSTVFRVLQAMKALMVQHARLGKIIEMFHTDSMDII